VGEQTGERPLDQGEETKAQETRKKKIKSKSQRRANAR